LILQDNKMLNVDFKANIIHNYTSLTIIQSIFFCIIAYSIFKFFCVILFK